MGRTLRSATWTLAPLLVTAIRPAGGAAQPAPPAERAEDLFASVAEPAEPFREMKALLEVTIFGIDVLTLTVRVGPETAESLRAVASGRAYSDALADSVAGVLLEARDVSAHQVLLRDVGFGRLMGGMRETTEKAAEAGYVSDEYFQEFASALPGLFAFLEERGARRGDEIFFRVRGDEVRTLYRTVEGEVRMDRTVTSASGRRASVPAFLAPGTRFRKRLVESLLRASSGGG